MAKVRFNTQVSNGTAYIRLVFRYTINSKPLKLVYSLGMGIDPAHWNPNQQRVRRAPGVNYTELNRSLDRLTVEADRIYQDCRSRGRLHELTLSRFRTELDVFWKGQYRSDEIDLYAFFGQLISEKEKALQRSTANIYTAALKSIKQLPKRISFEHIDLDFLADWTEHMRANGLSANTIWVYVSKLKTVMDEARERNLHSNLAYQSKRFNVQPEEVDNTYLSEGELQQLINTQMPTQQLEEAKVLFLVSCFTALRWSDSHKVSKAAVVRLDGVDFLRVIMKKKRKRKDREVFIPISVPLRMILDEYNWELPKPAHYATMLKRTREICRIAGFADPVPHVKRVQGVRVRVDVPKWEAVTWHTARRSFATNEYLKAIAEGRSIRPIMDIGGWSKEETFLKYIKVGKLESTLKWVKSAG